MTHSITALNAPVAILGESPVWVPGQQALYWADIDGHVIHRYDLEAGQVTESRSIDGRPGSFAPTADPNVFVVAVENQLVKLDWSSGQTTPVVDLEPAGTGNRLNDGRCDPAGRYVVGSMDAAGTADGPTGILHQFDGSTDTTLATAIGTSNGIAFDPDRSRMYFADTPTEKVTVFDYNHETGEAANRRLFFDYADVPGKPDGACVDAEGCYWSASVYGWALLRITPDGKVDRSIEVPIQKPSMPCFGGPDLDILFVTTIGAGGSKPSEPGRDGFTPGATLMITDLGIQGRPEPHFTS